MYYMQQSLFTSSTAAAVIVYSYIDLFDASYLNKILCNTTIKLKYTVSCCVKTDTAIRDAQYKNKLLTASNIL